MSDVLQPHDLAERGLGLVFGPSPTADMEVTLMDLRPQAPQGGTYIATEDVIETLPDGRTIQVAVKGAPMPMADAIRLGLVKASAPAGPSESKAEMPKPPESEPDEEDGPTAEEQAQATEDHLADTGKKARDK